MILPLLHTDCFQYLALNADLMSFAPVCIYAYEYTCKHIQAKPLKWAGIWQEPLLVLQTHMLVLATGGVG